MDVRKYILDNGIEIRISPKYIDVVNYKDIGHFDSNNITIYYEDGMIKISGNNLVISKLLNKEILILGNISLIELR